MTNYKDLGLVNSREIFKKALKGGYAIGAYNFSNMEQMQAIILACVETRSPVILQVSKGARDYANINILTAMAKGGVEYAKSLGVNIPIVLHLDHGADFDICASCIDNGFSSVMIDASSKSFEENIKLTKKVVDYAKKFDVSVEAELGVLSGIEDEVKSDSLSYTRPEDVIEFVEKTQVDSLAISIGTSHGANKFKKEQCSFDEKTKSWIPPSLRFDILEKVQEKLKDFPIVLHGSSSVPKEYVEIINKYGGALKDSIGIPEEELRKASKTNVCKINIDSDGRLVMTAMIRKYLAENPSVFDPRKYLAVAREELKNMYKHKNIDVLGCDNKI